MLKSRASKLYSVPVNVFLFWLTYPLNDHAIWSVIVDSKNVELALMCLISFVKVSSFVSEVSIFKSALP